MQMFNKLAEDRLNEERLYTLIAAEIAEGSVKAGLWTKAVAQANGDETKIEPNYIKLRLQNLRDEIAVAAAEEAERLRKKKEAEAAAEEAEEAERLRKKKEAELRMAQRKAESEKAENEKSWEHDKDDSPFIVLWWIMGVLACVLVLSVIIEISS